MHDGGQWILKEDGKMERTVEEEDTETAWIKDEDAGNSGVLSAQLI